MSFRLKENWFINVSPVRSKYSSEDSTVHFKYYCYINDLFGDFFKLTSNWNLEKKQFLTTLIVEALCQPYANINDFEMTLWNLLCCNDLLVVNACLQIVFEAIQHKIFKITKIKLVYIFCELFFHSNKGDDDERLIYYCNLIHVLRQDKEMFKLYKRIVSELISMCESDKFECDALFLALQMPYCNEQASVLYKLLCEILK